MHAAPLTLNITVFAQLHNHNNAVGNKFVNWYMIIDVIHSDDVPVTAM